jgi:hypothetical protein
LPVIASPDERPLKTNDHRVFIALNGIQRESNLESWRFDFSEENEYYLIYRLADKALLSQHKLNLPPLNPGLRFTIDLPPSLTCKAGTVRQCVIAMFEPRFPVYVTPIALKRMDATGIPFNGCPWVGKTRVFLSKENDFQAVFSFMALASGIYQLDGIELSPTPNDSEQKLLSVAQQIAICIIQ